MSELYLTGQLDAKNSESFIVQLGFLVSHGIKRITINIDTLGGFDEPVRKICDAIENAKNDNVAVTGLVIGECSSFGILVLQACSHRFAKDNRSVFGFHLNSFTIKVTIKTSKDDLLKTYDQMFRRLEITQELFCLFVEKRTLQPQRVIQGWIEVEKVFSAQEALKVNLIDGIMSELVDAF